MTQPAPSQLDRYAVVGNPIAHSRSPGIHALFAQSLGHALTYERILAPLDGFDATIDAFFAQGGKGLNVTVPFKREAWLRAQHRSPRAESAGALNTLWMHDGILHGDNTDGVGLVRDLVDNLGLNLTGARILLVGAGGAARGVLRPLIAAAPKALVIVNRTRGRADELARLARSFVASAARGAAEMCEIDSADFMLLPDNFDLVINATSASLGGEIPPLPSHVFGPHSFAYDMMYGSKPTLFMDYVLALGARATADGLGMLVEQAAESFLDWRGVRPQTAPVIEAMRERIRTEAHPAL
jgi:shikimate dehydrogenase